MNKADKHLFWKQQLDNWRSSGMSQKAYCAQQSLKTSFFSYWVKQLRTENAPSSKLIPITIPKEVVSVSLTASVIQLDVSVDVLEQVLPVLCRNLQEIR